MKIVDIRERDAFDRAAEAIANDAIIVQLPTVFVLLATPTSTGAAQLDRSKTRLVGKNYGTAIGSLTRFLSQADSSHLPPAFSRPQDFERMTGTFIRLRFREPEFESAVIRGGTHQGVLLDGIHRELFERLEESFLSTPPDAMWGETNYHGPLCTSCNVSGDPAGSIVDIDRALSFAHDRGIELMLTCTSRATELGSYPIFGYEKHRVTIHREGPFLEHFKEQIPVHLRAW